MLDYLKDCFLRKTAEIYSNSKETGNFLSQSCYSLINQIIKIVSRIWPLGSTIPSCSPPKKIDPDSIALLSCLPPEVLNIIIWKVGFVGRANLSSVNKSFMNNTNLLTNSLHSTFRMDMYDIPLKDYRRMRAFIENFSNCPSSLTSSMELANFFHKVAIDSNLLDYRAFGIATDFYTTAGINGNVEARLIMEEKLNDKDITAPYLRAKIHLALAIIYSKSEDIEGVVAKHYQEALIFGKNCIEEGNYFPLASFYGNKLGSFSNEFDSYCNELLEKKINFILSFAYNTNSSQKLMPYYHASYWLLSTFQDNSYIKLPDFYETRREKAFCSLVLAMDIQEILQMADEINCHITLRTLRNFFSNRIKKHLDIPDEVKLEFVLPHNTRPPYKQTDYFYICLDESNDEYRKFIPNIKNSSFSIEKSQTDLSRNATHFLLVRVTDLCNLKDLFLL